MANNYTYNTVTVATTATVIVAADSKRQGLIVTNESSAKLFFGPDDSITTANATSLAAGGTLVMSNPAEMYRGVIYGIVAADTSDIRYFEWGIQ